MQERVSGEVAQTEQSVGPLHWGDWGLLALLLILTGSLRLWLLCHTEVTARDSIGFIRYALQFESHSWTDVVRGNHQHPGYPLTILAVSLPVRHYLGAQPTAATMQLSAQLASSLAALLLVVPMYFLGRAILSRGVGFAAAIVFQCLPLSGHILSDGLSEALFLLLSATSMLFAVLAVQRRQLIFFALCGASCGLTYLTRPEGAFVLVATGLTLLWLQAMPRCRRPWREVVVCGAILIATASAVGSPYVLATRGFTNKPSAQQFLGNEPAWNGAPDVERGEWTAKREARSAGTGPRSALRSPLSALHSPLSTLRPPHSAALAVVVQMDGPLVEKLWLGLQGLATELAKGFHYWLWLPALLGLWWNSRQIADAPGMLVIMLLCAIHALVLWRLIVAVGYLSDRHVLLLVLGGVYPAMSALLELPQRLTAAWCLRDGVLATSTQPRARIRSGAMVWLALVLMGIVGAALPQTLKTLHGNRAGYHAAGLWLAEHAQPADLIEDDHCWAHYYAGRVFQEGISVAPPPGQPRWCYTVIGRSRDRERGELRWLTEEAFRRQGRSIVYHWPAHYPVERAEVVVYATALPRPS